VLDPPADADGLVVVTTEEVTAPGAGEVVLLQQLVCVLRDGNEVGVYRPEGSDELAHWSTTDPTDDSPALRPRDVASNTARRAFGLPSLVEVPPVTDLLARAWLLAVAGEAVERFDATDGPTDVAPEELEEVAARPPLGPDLPVDDVTWGTLHRAAVAGRLELGPFTADPAHAAWLDTDGFAQLLDRTLPAVEQLLGTLQVVGEDELLAWAIDWLSARAWYRPEVT